MKNLHYKTPKGFDTKGRTSEKYITAGNLTLCRNCHEPKNTHWLITDLSAGLIFMCYKNYHRGEYDPMSNLELVEYYEKKNTN